MTSKSNNNSAKLDLKGLQTLCSTNYLRLCRLLPDGQQGFSYGVSPAASRIGGSQLELTTLQTTPYTTLLNVILRQEADQNNIIELQVRSYHDVHMAEVVSCNKYKHFKLFYQYPNPQMYQSNEKYQLNQLLAEWLKSCALHGRSDNVYCQQKQGLLSGDKQA
ncbi:hypothetical protein SIN8267_02959 [Sinobacterium norvegicum]|uniref:DUF1249 domain-containing protein n=1 Tax=Sinobacterium norvegicum TaxID=1641715 RepID=A0ABN8EKE5_9GAMM|nr:DUF1249 domain-containing protein [Sinobacterium norvegicum]CAH0992822.1 hypothetical protein SIN8267_02959 [Sinobacterium norvegicum]